jgi:predicted phage gp36 major capsid-like protein
MKETKQAAASPEARAALHEVLAAFEGFKAANDQRLAALETKRADVLLEEKVARIDDAVSNAQARLDRVLADARRPSIGGDAPLARVDERKAAFDRYIKTGETPALLLEAKGLSEGVATAGATSPRPSWSGRSCGVSRRLRPCATSARCAPSAPARSASRSRPPAWPPAGWPRPLFGPRRPRPPWT